jgi:hypothetical protein
MRELEIERPAALLTLLQFRRLLKKGQKTAKIESEYYSRLKLKSNSCRRVCLIFVDAEVRANRIRMRVDGHDESFISK